MRADAVAAALGACLLAGLLHWILLTHTHTHTHTQELLVVVLSSRDHFELRQAVRDTWLGHLRERPRLHTRVLVKFLVGGRGCPVPAEDREDPYSCSLLNITDGASGEVSAWSWSDTSALKISDVSALSLDFSVLHPVVITQLGVFPNAPGLQLQGSISISLYQLEREGAVLSALFNSSSPGRPVSGVLYKPVEQFILPKGFQGTLLWEAHDSAPLMTVSADAPRLQTGGGVLAFSPTAEGTLPDRSARAFPGIAGGFTFTVYDMKSLSAQLRGRASRRSLRWVELQEEEACLQREAETHGDVLLVDVLDTYRNLPLKLLHFYRWSIENSGFQLLLKTDDDCFLNVDAVLAKIQRLKRLKRGDVWWGNFRQNWAVQRWGKWRELQYHSAVYPAFACGSGYVLTRPMVEWLSRNADALKPYQGEDVSLGIWMAAVGPQKYQDSGWLCERSCSADMLSSPQLSAAELRSLWASQRKCGDPCGCGPEE